MEAIILAGGFGTRLQSVVSDLPKSMAGINGRPFLEYLFDVLIRQGIQRSVLAVGYKHEMISGHFGSSYKSMEIEYSVENEPLGTGGAIRLAFWKIHGDRAIALNGDSMFKVDYLSMYEKHIRHSADITMAVRQVPNANRYGSITLGRNARINGFSEKSPEVKPGLINGGVYYIEKKYLMKPQFRGKFSLEKDCFEAYFSEDRFFGFKSKDYFIDIGIPQDYQKAQDDFAGFENR